MDEVDEMYFSFFVAFEKDEHSGQQGLIVLFLPFSVLFLFSFFPERGR